MTIRNSGINRFVQAELIPSTLGSVPAGTDGQLAVVTDQPGVNLVVRQGGTLVPAIVAGGLPKTTSWIEMTVDPVAGTSPPAGTVVTNQAEYDALGYDLLYAQDVIDILPKVMRHGVVVTLKAGAHAGNYNRTGGDYGLDPWLYFPDFLWDAAEAYWEAGDGREIGIYFEGEDRTNVGSEVECTWDVATTDIIRDSGTWTVNEHAGRLLIVTAGSGAGTILPIYGNTTTALQISTVFGTGTYAATVQIFEPAAVVSGMYTLLTTIPYEGKSQYACRLLFSNLKLEADDLFWYGNVSFQYCMMALLRIKLRQESLDENAIFANYCALALTSLYGWIISLQGYWTIALSTIRGAPTDSSGTITPLVYVKDGTLYSISSRYGANYEAVPSYDGPLIRIRNGRVIGGNFNYLTGNDLTTGVLFDGGSLEMVGTDIPWIISDNAIAVNVATSNPTNVSGLNSDSAGNDTGWQVTLGGRLVVYQPANIAAVTNDLLVDGVAKTYASDLTSEGSIINGAKGSIVVRRGT